MKNMLLLTSNYVDSNGNQKKFIATTTNVRMETLGAGNSNFYISNLSPDSTNENIKAVMEESQMSESFMSVGINNEH